MCLIRRKKQRLLYDTIAALQTQNMNLRMDIAQNEQDVIDLTSANAKLTEQLKNVEDGKLMSEIISLKELNRGLASSLSEAKIANKRLTNEIKELRTNLKLMRRKYEKAETEEEK